MVFLIILLLTCCATGAPLRPSPRTAAAVIYEEDGLWGSIVFRQESRGSDVSIHASFKNVGREESTVGYEIRSEPVHYDMYPRGKLCSDAALRGVLNASGRRIGELARPGRMGRMRAPEFSQRFEDGEISLFEDSGRNIVGRSFVVRVGAQGRFACATIERVDNGMEAGLVPCVRRSYEECLVGTEDPGVCVYRRCDGFERFWGTVDGGTRFCRVVEQVYPKEFGEGRGAGGTVECKHAPHSLLVPVGRV